MYNYEGSLFTLIVGSLFYLLSTSIITFLRLFWMARDISPVFILVWLIKAEYILIISDLINLLALLNQIMNTLMTFFLSCLEEKKKRNLFVSFMFSPSQQRAHQCCRYEITNIVEFLFFSRPFTSFCRNIFMSWSTVRNSFANIKWYKLYITTFDMIWLISYY